MSMMFATRYLVSGIKNAGFHFGNKLVNVHEPSAFLLSRRFLYSSDYLGLDNFINQRTKVSSQFGHLKESLINRLKSTLDGQGRMIFSEDLKNVIFLSSETPEDLETLKKIIARYAGQSGDVKFSPYQFGPLVIRLLYLLDKPDDAFKFLMSDDYGDFFKGIKSYLLAMSLLWKNEKYQEILDLFDRFESLDTSTGSSTDIFTLLMGACYKLNTPESYKFALEKLTARREKGGNVTPRLLYFFTALALKQKESEIAIESITMVPRMKSAIGQTLRILGLADLKRFDDIIYTIKNIMNVDRLPERGFILSEAIEKVAIEIEGTGNAQLKEEWESLHQALRENNMISLDSLDSRLCKDIERRPEQSTNPRMFNDRQPERPYSRQGYRPRRTNEYSDYGYQDRRRPVRSDYDDRRSQYGGMSSGGGRGFDFD